MIKKISIIVLIVNLTFIFLYFFTKFILEIRENIEVNNYITETTVINNDKSDNEKPKKSNAKDINYTAILEIPTINLKRGVVDNTKNFASIKYAISVDNISKYPDINGNFILYAHSGNSKIAFFKNLVKVNINDKVYVYYNGIKYEYEIFDKYDIEKTGKASVIITDKERYITLITCNQSHKGYQVVLVGKQINQMKY